MEKNMLTICVNTQRKSETLQNSKNKKEDSKMRTGRPKQNGDRAKQEHSGCGKEDTAKDGDTDQHGKILVCKLALSFAQCFGNDCEYNYLNTLLTKN